MAVSIPCPKCGENLVNGIAQPCPACGWAPTDREIIDAQQRAIEGFTSLLKHHMDAQRRLVRLARRSMLLNIFLGLGVIGLVIALLLD